MIQFPFTLEITDPEVECTQTKTFQSKEELKAWLQQNIDVGHLTIEYLWAAHLDAIKAEQAKMQKQKENKETEPRDGKARAAGQD